jgi:hypothetical protein
LASEKSASISVGLMRKSLNKLSIIRRIIAPACSELPDEWIAGSETLPDPKLG